MSKDILSRWGGLVQDQRWRESALVAVWGLVTSVYALNSAYVTSDSWALVPALIVIWGVLLAGGWRRGYQFMLRLTLPLVAAASALTVVMVGGAAWHPLSMAVLIGGALLLLVATGWKRVVAAGVCLVGLVLTISSDFSWGKERIDVFIMLQRGALGFLAGQNPYHLWFPSGVPGIARFHYDYGPVLIVLSAPFAGIGDVRLLMMLAAAAILGAGAWWLRRHPQDWDWLALLGLSPWLFWPVIHAWTELVAMGLLMGWYVTRRVWRWSWIFLAAGLAVTPVILVLVVPMAVLMPGRRRQLAAACGVGLLAYLLAVLLSGPVVVQALLTDAHQGYITTVGLGGLYRLLFDHPMSSAVAAAVLLVSSFLVWRARPWTVAQRELAVGLIALATVLALPTSFFEYMFLPMVWLWWAMRATRVNSAAVSSGSVGRID